MSADDVELARRGYAAFVAGDMETLGGLLAEDATWTVPGHGATSGVKEGRNAILAYFGDLASRTGGALEVTLVDVADGEGCVFALHRVKASRNGADLDMSGVNVFQISNGQVRAVQEYFEDTAANDAFWS